MSPGSPSQLKKQNRTTNTKDNRNSKDQIGGITETKGRHRHSSLVILTSSDKSDESYQWS